MADDLSEGAIAIEPEDIVTPPAAGAIEISPADIVPAPASGRTKTVRPMRETIADLPGKIYDYGKRLVTGEGRREEGLEEIPDEFIPNFGTIAGRTSLARTPEGKLDIYKQARPDAQSRVDAYGNPVVTAPDGKEGYINKPGASWRDIPDLATEAAFLAPAIRGGAVVGKAVGPLGRIFGTGAGAGTGSIIQDVASRDAGSKQPVDLPGALTYAAVGAGGEMLAPALSPLARAITRKEVVDLKTGKLTPHGMQALKDAGIDPASVTDEFAKRFAAMADKATDPAQAARMAEAQTLPVPVPQTRGTVTGNPSDQMFEDLAGKGAYGEVAGSTIRDARDATNQALHQNLPAIQGAVAKGPAQLAQTGEAGPVVQARLKAMAAAEKRGVDEAYETLRGTDAQISRPLMDDLRTTARTAIEAEHDLLGLPATTRFLKQLDDMVEAVPVNVGPGYEMPTQSVRKLIDMDKRITNAQKAGGEEAMALGKIKSTIRGKLDDALAQGLLLGDDKTIDLFKNALQSHREYARRFKGENIVGALVKPKRGDDLGTLAVSPEAASNVIFGSSRLFGGPEVSRNVARLKGLLGADSKEWNAIREEAWLRFARAGDGPVRPDGGRAFSGAKFAKALDDTLRDHPAAMKALFTQEELGLMQQFKRVAARTTIPVEGGKNFSNTTPALANVAQSLFNAAFMGENASARLASTIGVKHLYKMGMAFKAASHRAGSITERRAAPGAGGVVAVGASEGVESRVMDKLRALEEGP